MIAIFQSCLLPKMRLSVLLEGRFTGYKPPLSKISLAIKYLLCISFFREKFHSHKKQSRITHFKENLVTYIIHGPIKQSKRVKNIFKIPEVSEMFSLFGLKM